MGYSREQRLALCTTLEEAGPDAPTLCAGWTALNLAAHLVLREHRLDASAGIPGGPLAGHTARVQDRLASRKSFPTGRRPAPASTKVTSCSRPRANRLRARKRCSD